MYIRSRKEFLILENLRQAREYLTKNEIDIELPEFQHIVKSLDKQPNLVGTFTRMVFKDGLDNLDNNINEFDRIYSWISSNRNIVNQLPQNLMKYADLEELSDDITELEYSRKVNLFTRELPLSTRKEVSQLDDSTLIKYNDLVISYLKLSNEQKSMMPPLVSFQSKYNSTIHDLIDSLDKLINSPNELGEERRRVRALVSRYLGNLDIVYDENNILVIESSDKETVCNLGAERWCFVYAPDRYYKEYVDPETLNTQYIIFNLNLPSSNRYSMFGVTLKPDGTTVHGGSQDKVNGHIPLDDIYELTGLPKGVLVSKYKDIHDDLIKRLESIDTNTSVTDVMELMELVTKFKIKLNITNGMLSWVGNQISGIDKDESADELSTIKYLMKMDKSIESVVELWLLEKLRHMYMFSPYSEILDIRLKSIKLGLGYMTENIVKNKIYGFITNSVSGNEVDKFSQLYNKVDQMCKELIVEYGTHLMIEDEVTDATYDILKGGDVSKKEYLTILLSYLGFVDRLEKVNRYHIILRMEDTKPEYFNDVDFIEMMFNQNPDLSLRYYGKLISKLDISVVNAIYWDNQDEWDRILSDEEEKPGVKISKLFIHLIEYFKNEELMKKFGDSNLFLFNARYRKVKVGESARTGKDIFEDVLAPEKFVRIDPLDPTPTLRLMNMRARMQGDLKTYSIWFDKSVIDESTLNDSLDDDEFMEIIDRNKSII